MMMYSTVSVLFKFSTRADDVEAQFIRGFDERKPRKDQSPAGSVFSSLGNLQPDAAVAPVVSMKHLLAAAFIRRKERDEGQPWSRRRDSRFHYGTRSRLRGQVLWKAQMSLSGSSSLSVRARHHAVTHERDPNAYFGDARESLP